MMARRWWVALFLGICMLFSASPALAQKVLMLTTDTGGSNSGFEEPEFTNLFTEFASVVGAGNIVRQSVLSTPNSINQATFSAGGMPYDIVIVATHYRGIDATNGAVLNSAIQNRWVNSVLFFVDGCCDGSNGGNAANVVASLNAASGGSLSLGSNLASKGSFPLNTNSPYHASFTGLDPMDGGFTTYINGVPANNALYLANGLAAGSFPPAGTALVNNVYALLVPATQSHAGLGACVFATVDLTGFNDAVNNVYTPQNKGKVAPAFLHAVTAPGGACGLPTVSKSFDKASVLLGGSGNTAQLTIQLSNTAIDDVLHAKVTDALPSPLVIGSGPITHTCTGGTLTGAAGGSTVGLDDFTIPHTNGCSITVPVVWPNTDAGRAACADPVARTVTNTIRPGVDFTPAGSGTDATATLTCQPGTLSVGKTVAWNAGSQPSDLTGASFPVSVSCTGTDGVAVPAITSNVVLGTPTTGSVSVVPVISSGNCTVAETSRPAAPANHQWVEAAAPSASIALQAPPGSAAVTLTNTLARLSASIGVTINVAGTPGGGMSGSFGVTANCGADGTYTGTVVLSNGSTATGSIAGAPQGASCSVSLDAALPTPPTNHAWSSSSSASVPVTVAASGNSASFSATLTRLTAAIALTKNVTGGPSGGISASFSFTANCGADGSFNGAVALSNAASGTASIANVPQGASCSVTENTPLPAAPANYTWGATPAAVAVTVAASGNAAVFTNTLTRNTASIGVTINVAGTPSGGMSGSFGVTANCGADGTYTGTVVLTNGSTATGSIAGVPQGAVCTVTTSSSLPTPPTNHAWSTTTPPTSVPVTVAATGNTATVSTTLERGTASIGVSFTVAGGSGGAGGSGTGLTGTVGFTANCGANGTYTGTVVLNNATTGTGTISNVPVGASCTVTTDSSSLPTPPTGQAWSSTPPASVPVVVATTGNTAAFTGTLVPQAAAGVTPVPTLGQWKLILLALLLASMAAPLLKRARRG